MLGWHASVCLWAAVVCRAIYLPGVSPSQYMDGDEVEMKVNKLTSAKTQLPYKYYTLPYCQPSNITDKVENLGEILTGDVIENSPYTIRMKVEAPCKHLCSLTLDKDHIEKFRSMIQDEYVVNWIVDNLPAATAYETTDKHTVLMSGFPVGVLKEGHYYVHNHVDLELKYHSSPNDSYEGFRVVGFQVVPRSVKHFADTFSCSSEQQFDIDAHNNIKYTYSVKWKASDIRWSSRWDVYLKMSGSQVQWFSVLNSVMIVLILSASIAMILGRTVLRDIVKYNELVSEEDAAEESGWKLVHGDVFRKPVHFKLLSVSVGSGLQVLGMSAVTIVAALLGFLSPAHRGALLQCMMVIFSLMGFVAGFFSTFICRLDDRGTDLTLKMATIMSATLYPGIIFTVFFVLNLFIWGQRSSGAVPFLTLFALLVLWFGISVPLVFMGASCGQRVPAITIPVQTNQLPRRIPQHPMNTLRLAFLAGLLPFACMFAELMVIMSSIWHHKFFYLMGFLAVIPAILVIASVEVSITFTYMKLTTEDYNWWWSSFWASGSCGLYVFLFSFAYFVTKLSITKFVPVLLYFGYMFIISLLVTLTTGAVGFVGSFVFVRAIYASIKVD